MYISRIKLRNWKNFKGVEAPLGQRVFLIGPKFWKVQPLGCPPLFRDVANDGLHKAVDDTRGGVAAIRCLAATRYSDIDIEVDITNGESKKWTYRLVLNQDNVKRPIVKEEAVSRNGDSLLGRPNTNDRQDPLLLTQTALEQLVNQQFREIADFFRSISHQHLIPQVVRDPRGFSPVQVQDDPYGRDFLLRLWRTPPKYRDTHFGELARLYRGRAPVCRSASYHG